MSDIVQLKRDTFRLLQLKCPQLKWTLTYSSDDTSCFESSESKDMYQIIDQVFPPELWQYLICLPGRNESYECILCIPTTVKVDFIARLKLNITYCQYTRILFRLN